jgi:predicted metalloprotease
MRGAGIGGLGMIVMVLIALYFGIDPTFLLQDSGPLGGGSSRQAPPAGGGAPDEMREFVAVVLGDTEETWHTIFQQAGRRYEEPKLILFSDQVRSACGLAGSAVGPFYCPGDHNLYIDLSFYRDLQNRFGAPGDFAQAYVIAHEVGHHVQTLLGIAAEVDAARRRTGTREANALSVRMELQADCFAGVWAHHADRARSLLEAGDVEEGLNAAAAIGDDRLQRQAQGHVVPDSFTHGSSAQRVQWFRRGIEAGDVDACDTFKSPDL